MIFFFRFVNNARVSWLVFKQLSNVRYCQGDTIDLTLHVQVK